MDRIKLLLIDDHEMVRMGLRTYLELDEEIEIVGEANNGLEGFELCKEKEPDIILMDLVMDKLNGIEATKKIMEYFNEKKDIKIIVLTSFIEEDKVMSALEAGAFSYLLKTSSADKILESIKKAYNDEPVFEGKVTSVMIKDRNKIKEKYHELTNREMEVLKELGKGKTNKEISESLFIGVKTVKSHISNILSKLELDDRTNAAIYANKHNLVD